MQYGPAQFGDLGELSMENPRLTSIAFHDELLANNWPDDDRVRALTGAQEGHFGSSDVSTLRAERRILGVWSPDRCAFFHPDFQFDQRGCIRPEIARLLAVLPAGNDRGGWARAFWLYSPHAHLGGKTPAEVFATAPERVIEAANREFGGSPDTGW
jgi:hypothetical protein